MSVGPGSREIRVDSDTFSGPLGTRVPSCTDPDCSTTANIDEKAGTVGLIGRSEAHRGALFRLHSAAQTRAEVLLIGETGVGKELYARYVHECSPRARGPFCPVNCAIQESLFDNELFGHAAGAFTGAGGRSDGLIAAAEGGTLFLDEVDHLPSAGQVKLLRFLQQKEYRRLGDSRLRRADVRVVSATNASPESSVRDGRLREDLYYRLNVIEERIAPLRDRPDDIQPLLTQFTNRYAAEYGRSNGIMLTLEATRKVLSYSWPGNIRQLENFVRSLVCQHPPDAVIGPDAISFNGSCLPTAGGDAANHDELFELPFCDAKRLIVDEFEREYLTRMLRATGGNVNRAAKLAGKNRRAFFELMRKHGIEREEYVPTT